MINEMDDYWKIFEEVTGDINEFEQRFLPSTFLKRSVPKDVQDSFKVITDLLQFSYCRHKFYDVACVQSLLILEMALKTKYKEIEGKEWGSKPLAQLIDWLKDRHYFEVYNPEFLKAIREIRNQLAHPKFHAIRGSGSKHIIEHVVDLINDLYEDAGLRKQRMALAIEIKNCFDQFSGGIKIISSEESLLCYKAWVPFINNKTNPNKVHFLFKPLFHTKDYLLPDRKMLPTKLVYVEAEEATIAGDAIVFTLPDKTELTVTGNLSLSERDTFNQWQVDYKSFCKQTADDNTTTFQITDSFLYFLREFHKQE